MHAMRHKWSSEEGCSPTFVVPGLNDAQGVQAIIGRVSKQQNNMDKQFVHMRSVVGKTITMPTAAYAI